MIQLSEPENNSATPSESHRPRNCRFQSDEARRKFDRFMDITIFSLLAIELVFFSWMKWG